MISTGKQVLYHTRYASRLTCDLDTARHELPIAAHATLHPLTRTFTALCPSSRLRRSLMTPASVNSSVAIGLRRRLVGAKKWRGRLAAMGIRGMWLVGWMTDRLESTDLAVSAEE